MSLRQTSTAGAIARRMLWSATVEGLGASAQRGVFERLIAAWSQPHRRYHTLQHLDECLMHLVAWSPGVPRHEVAAALWFHDAVYEPGASDNEERSAEMARFELTADGVAQASVDRIVELVLATKHSAPQERPLTKDEQLLVDIDMAILGATPARFAEYERQICEEYASVPPALYRVGRARFIQGVLALPRIYITEPAYREREAQARANLGDVLPTYLAA